jgi:hypothetical protein
VKNAYKKGVSTTPWGGFISDSSADDDPQRAAQFGQMRLAIISMETSSRVLVSKYAHDGAGCTRFAFTGMRHSGASSRVKRRTTRGKRRREAGTLWVW